MTCYKSVTYDYWSLFVVNDFEPSSEEEPPRAGRPGYRNKGTLTSRQLVHVPCEGAIVLFLDCQPGPWSTVHKAGLPHPLYVNRNKKEFLVKYMFLYGDKKVIFKEYPSRMSYFLKQI